MDANTLGGPHGTLPALVAAARAKQPEAVQLLLQANALVSAECPVAGTALHAVLRSCASLKAVSYPYMPSCIESLVLRHLRVIEENLFGGGDCRPQPSEPQDI